MLNNKFEELTIHDAANNMGTSKATRVTPAQQDVFTFVTVYYKHGEWGTDVFDTLREGLLEYVDETAPESEKKSLVLLDDDQLADRLLEIGMHSRFISGHLWKGAGKRSETLLIYGVGIERIQDQIGHGLVGIIKGPRFQKARSRTVFLEMYYKYGEWELKEGHSSLLDDAKRRIEREMGEDEWDELDEDEKMEAALKLSGQDVADQEGWGVVKTFPGRIYAIA